MSADDMTQYRDLFLGEAAEHVASMNAALLALEKSPADRRPLDDLLRAAHTLKGMASTMCYEKTAALCHAIEDLLAPVKEGKRGLETGTDLLFECFDAIESSLKNITQNQTEQDSGDLVRRAQAFLASEQPAQSAKPRDAAPLMPEKIRAIEVKVERLDTLMTLAEELLVNRLRLGQCSERLQDPELSAAADTVSRLVSDLQYNVVRARMVPIGFVFNRFPRMVRDLAKRQEKDVELLTQGGDIELDRAVIEGIGEALVHLLRNAVDHGIEPPGKRADAGKPPRGTLRLTARRVRGLVEIEVADDGDGLDVEGLRGAAVRRGLLPEGASPEAVLETLFSGLSTTRNVTQVSGRGLGLHIVKMRIESLGGSVRCLSEAHKGTTYVVEIPLTLAIIKALFVEVGGRQYAVPVANVDRLVTVNADAIKGVMGYEAFVFDKEEVPVTRLDVLFGTPRAPQPTQPILIARRGESRLGLAVDGFAGTQEIVVKPLNRLVKENRYFAGSTIVGSGEAALILDVNNLALSRKVRRAAEPHVEEPLAVLAEPKE